MARYISDGRKRCKAMTDADIDDPESQDGISFCLESCPYEYCVVFENPETARQFAAKEKAKFARALRAHGVSVDDIALILGVGLRTVQRLLKKRKEDKE